MSSCMVKRLGFQLRRSTNVCLFLFWTFPSGHFHELILERVVGFCVGSEVYFGQSCTLFFVWLCGFSVRDLSYPPCKKVEDRFGATWPGEPPPQWRAERNWREGPTLECQSVHSYCGEVAKWNPRPSFVASFESHVQGMVGLFEDLGERSVGSEKKITCTFFLSIHMVTQWSRKPLRWD